MKVVIELPKQQGLIWWCAPATPHKGTIVAQHEGGRGVTRWGRVSLLWVRNVVFHSLVNNSPEFIVLTKNSVSSFMLRVCKFGS